MHAYSLARHRPGVESLHGVKISRCCHLSVRAREYLECRQPDCEPSCSGREHATSSVARNALASSQISRLTASLASCLLLWSPGAAAADISSFATVEAVSGISTVLTEQNALADRASQLKQVWVNLTCDTHALADVTCVAQRVAATERHDLHNTGVNQG